MPLSFSFKFPFFLFFSFIVFPPAFVVLRVPLACSFFVRFNFSSGRFPLFLCRLLRFLFRFSALLGGGFCYSVISSWSYTPLALLTSRTYAYSLACYLLCCVLDVDIIYFLFFAFPLLISIWTSFFSSCLFLVGTMLSPRCRLLLRFASI